MALIQLCKKVVVEGRMWTPLYLWLPDSSRYLPVLCTTATCHLQWCNESGGPYKSQWIPAVRTYRLCDHKLNKPVFFLKGKQGKEKKTEKIETQAIPRRLWVRWLIVWWYGPQPWVELWLKSATDPGASHLRSVGQFSHPRQLLAHRMWGSDEMLHKNVPSL